MTTNHAAPVATLTQQATATPRRDAYHRHLAMIAYSLAEAARLNPNEEHRLMTILAEVETIQAGR